MGSFLFRASDFFGMWWIDDKCLFLEHMTGCCHYEIDIKEERLVVVLSLMSNKLVVGIVNGCLGRTELAKSLNDDEASAIIVKPTQLWLPSALTGSIKLQQARDCWSGGIYCFAPLEQPCLWVTSTFNTRRDVKNQEATTHQVFEWLVAAFNY